MMNFRMLDLLDKAIAKDTENDITLLMKEGVLTSEGQIVQNKLNLMTGAYAADLMDGIIEADMSTEEFIDYIESLYKQNQYMGIFHFLLSLFIAMEMDVPYLFMLLPSHSEVLQVYIGELITDLKDYNLDLSQEE